MFVEKFQRHTRVCVPHTNLDRLGINLSTHGKKEKEKKKGGEKKNPGTVENHWLDSENVAERVVHGLMHRAH